MALQQEISLSFFPLLNSQFNFRVYRRLFNQGEKKEEFPSCSKRSLPITDDLEQRADYWVSLNPENLERFEEFECTSLTNIPLTIEFLFELLKQNCEKNNIKDFFVSRDSFRYHTVFFILKEFSEGRQCVWLEPYYLKSSKKFGFLVDFKFERNEDIPFNKRIQQLSLSLDQSGRSNANYYIDKHEKIREFIRIFYDKTFHLNYLDGEIRIEKNFLMLESDSLRFKTYVFLNNNTDKSQFVGVKNKGPLTLISNPVKIYFIYKEGDKSLSHDLFRALRGDTFSSTFPGMEKMFRYILDNKTVGGGEVRDFSQYELEKVIKTILHDSEGKAIVPVLVTPFSKDDYDEEASDQYYAAKYTFLKYHLPSQFVSSKRLMNKEQLKWAISNIALQLFSKMGGQPWKVMPETEKCLIIGLGQSHKKTKHGIEKYFAYSILTDSSGLYKDLKVLGQSEDRDTYLAGFRSRLTEIFRQYYNEYNDFVVHTTFAIRDEELEVLNSVLQSFSRDSESQKSFTVMRFDERNKFFGYSQSNNSLVPYESTFVRIAEKEFLVWFEGLQIQTPTIRKRIERPLHVSFLYSSHYLDYITMKRYLQDAVNLSGANWRGFNAKSLPVSVYYAQLVARYYKEFQSLGYEDIDLEKITPWFL